MRKVLKINFRSIFFSFLCFATVFSFLSGFKTYAIAPPDLNRLGFYDEASWCPNFLDPPYSLTQTEADSLSAYCGTVVNSDGSGPIEGVTVFEFFGDPNSPTLKFEGRLTGLYNSTGTDERGRFHLTTTKVGPGGFTVYLAFYCNDDQLSVQRATSTFDNYQIDPGPYVSDLTDCVYDPNKPPFVEIEVAQRGITLGADVGETGFEDDVPIGSEIDQDLAFNTTAGEKYHDLRFTKLDARIQVGDLFAFGAYEQTGGLSELDCLEKYHDAYYCNYRNTMYSQNRDDYLTRIAFGFIPKQCEFPTERRFEIRGNLKNMSKDPLLAAQTNYALYGDYNNAETDLSLRAFGTPKIGESALQDCECLKASNSVIPDPGMDTLCPDRNSLKSGGIISRIIGPLEAYNMYYSGAREVDWNQPVCRNRGSDVTVYQLAQCAFDGICPSGISNDHWRPELLLSNGETYYGATSRSAKDSKDANTVKAELYHDRVTTAHSRSPYMTGSAVPTPTGDINGEVSGLNSFVRAMRVTSFDIVPNDFSMDPYQDDRPLSHAYINPTAQPKEYFDDVHSSINQVYTMENLTKTATVGLVDKDVPYTSERSMKLDNYFQAKADYADPEVGDSYGHSRNKAASTAIFYTANSVLRDQAFEGDPGYDLTEGRGDQDHAIDGLLSVIAYSRRARTIYDSLLTIISGDGEASLPVTPNGDGFDFSVPVQALGVSYSAALSRDGPEKSMGERDEVVFPTIERDELLQVEFPLCEDNFNDTFYPPRSPYNTSSDPQSWGEHECYPWHTLPIGQSCGTFDGEVSFTDPASGDTITYTDPELANGTSRTCRVEACRTFSVRTICDCDGSGNPYNCRTREGDGTCSESDNFACASNGAQTSCLDPVTGAIDEECVYETNNFDPDDLNPQCRGRTNCEDCATDSQGMPACTMGRAGPYICAGELEVGNPDLIRVRQELPLNTYGEDPPVQKNTNSIVESFKVIESFTKSPVDLPVTASAISEADVEITDNKDIAPNVYTYGQDFITTEGSPLYLTSLRRAVASPTPDPDNIPASDISSPPQIGIRYHIPNTGFRIRDIDIMMPMEQPNRHSYNDAGEEIDFDATLQEPPEPASINDLPYQIFGPPRGIEMAMNSNSGSNSVYAIEYIDNGPPPLTSFGACDIRACSHPSVPPLSNTAINIINAAASRFNMPPALLVAYIATEGEAFSPPLVDHSQVPEFNAYADDEIVRNWSEEYYGRISLPGQYALCEDVKWSEQGPFQWIKKWWDDMLEEPEVIAALNELGDRRAEWASRCNFLDAAIVTAAALSHQSNPPDTCNWDRTLVEQSAEAISGGAYESGNIGNIWDVYSSCQ